MRVGYWYGDGHTYRYGHWTIYEFLNHLFNLDWYFFFDNFLNNFLHRIRHTLFYNLFHGIGAVNVFFNMHWHRHWLRHRIWYWYMRLDYFLHGVGAVDVLWHMHWVGHMYRTLNNLLDVMFDNLLLC